MSTLRYQNLMTILGVPKDNRFRLVLAGLHDLAKKVASENNRSNITPLDIAMLNPDTMPILFTGPVIGDRTKINKEIKKFEKDLTHLENVLDAGKHTNLDQDDKAILKNIMTNSLTKLKELSTGTDNGSGVLSFSRALVAFLFDIKDIDGTLINNHTNYTNATDIKYRGAIATTLFNSTTPPVPQSSGLSGVSKFAIAGLILGAAAAAAIAAQVAIVPATAAVTMTSPTVLGAIIDYITVGAFATQVPAELASVFGISVGPGAISTAITSIAGFVSTYGAGAVVAGMGAVGAAGLGGLAAAGQGLQNVVSPPAPPPSTATQAQQLTQDQGAQFTRQGYIDNIKNIIGDAKIFIPYYKGDEGKQLTIPNKWRYLSSSYTNTELNAIVDNEKFANHGEYNLGGSGFINKTIGKEHSIKLVHMDKMARKHWKNDDELKALSEKLSDRGVQDKIRDLGLSSGFKYTTKYLKQSGGGDYADRWVNPSGFSVQVDKFTIHRLIESLNGLDITSDKGPSVQFFVGSYNTRYARNNKGELVNQKGERYEEGSVNFNKMTRDDNCFTTQLNVQNPMACQDYVDKCLLGSDVSDCQQWLTSPNFWTALESEVNKMNPMIAVHTLKKFGFRVKQSGSNKLVEAESYSSWSENLSNNKTLTPDQVSNIRNNVYLSSYLAAVIHLVNFNKDILNKRDPTRLHGKPNYKYGVNTKAKSADVLRSSTLMRLHNSIVTRNNFINMSYSSNMTGGGNKEITWSDMYEKHPNYIADEMRSYFSAFDRRLNGHNKRLANNDRKLVNDLVNKLADNEAKLYKTISFLEKYTLLLNLFSNDHNKEVLNFDTVQKYVQKRNKYFNKTSKLQNNVSLVVANLAISAEDIKNKKNQ
jgi:hypothetical protein